MIQPACGRDVRRDRVTGVGGNPARTSELHSSSWAMSSGQSGAIKGFNQGGNVVRLNV